MRRLIVEYGFHEHYEELKKDFPKNLHESVRSHEDLYSTDNLYQELLGNSPAWYWLDKKVHSYNFWKPILDKFGLYISAPFNDYYREPRSGVVEEHFVRFLYARMDIGLGLPGYGIENGGRGLHIDNPQRIISGLLYFTDQRELDGGEFDVCDEDGCLYQRISLKENMAILSLQNEDAWHRVSPLLSGERRAVYFALNASWRYWDR